MAKSFDITEHISEFKAADPTKRRALNVINCYMNAIGHLPFKTLYRSRVAEILGRIEKSLTSVKGSGDGKELPAALAAVRKLRTASGELTVQQLFLSREGSRQKVIQAARRLHRTGIPVPLMQARATVREEYFAELILARTLRILGAFTPRDLFERDLVETSELERSVLLEAKMVGLIPSCAPNGKGALIDPDSGHCKCVTAPRLQCAQSQTGKCAAGSDIIVLPQVDPTPGGTDNP